MNLHAPKQHLRESKHSSKAMSNDFSRCRPSSHTYSYAHARKSYEQEHADEAVKSRSIPICKAALRRTASELKLYEDEVMADFQDYVFFTRLLTGISKQQQESVSDAFLQESDECLAHIIGTRNGSVDEVSKYSSAATSFFDDMDRPTSARFEEEKDEGIFVMDF